MMKTNSHRAWTPTSAPRPRRRRSHGRRPDPRTRSRRARRDRRRRRSHAPAASTRRAPRRGRVQAARDTTRRRTPRRRRALAAPRRRTCRSAPPRLDPAGSRRRLPVAWLGGSPARLGMAWSRPSIGTRPGGDTAGAKYGRWSGDGCGRSSPPTTWLTRASTTAATEANQRSWIETLGMTNNISFMNHRDERLRFDQWELENIDGDEDCYPYKLVSNRSSEASSLYLFQISKSFLLIYLLPKLKIKITKLNFFG